MFFSSTTAIRVSAETRIAVVDEKNTLVEFHIDRINQKSLVGGVYQGRVVRVEKGMDAAFLDVGIGENVFMSRPGKVHEGENFTVQVSRNAGVEKPPHAAVSQPRHSVIPGL